MGVGVGTSSRQAWLGSTLLGCTCIREKNATLLASLFVCKLLLLVDCCLCRAAPCHAVLSTVPAACCSLPDGQSALCHHAHPPEHLPAPFSIWRATPSGLFDLQSKHLCYQALLLRAHQRVCTSAVCMLLPASCCVPVLTVSQWHVPSLKPSAFVLVERDTV